MRNSLKDIEMADNYLNGKLSPTEAEAFTKELETNTELQQLVNIQKDLRQAIKRKALKEEINKIKNSGGSNLSNWLFGGAILIIILTISLFLFKDNLSEKSAGTYSLESSNAASEEPASEQTTDSSATQMVALSNDAADKDMFSFNGLKTWAKPFVQTFQVIPSAGATIEGKEGTLVIIPSNAFVDDKNRIINETVQFGMVEALRLEDMVLYNLSTTADGKALETGGMLHFNFTCNGRPVKVNPARPLYVEVPTNKVKKDMMAFEGVVSNNKVNWKNPKPLKKFLVNVNFELLDFLPEGFEDTVKSVMPYKGHTIADRELVDSLYYSLLLKKKMGNKISTRESDIYWEGESREKINNTTDTTSASSLSNNLEQICYGVDPLSVKTIRTESYSQTFIATKEFGERIRELHRLEKGNELLKVYINNLGGNLSRADSLVALKLKNESRKIFDGFALQGLTNIKDAQIYQDRLNAYYNKKYKEYESSRAKLQNELRSKNEAELSKLIKDYKNYLKSIEPKSVRALPVVASQLPPANAAISPVYSFQWAASGWVNIDCYLHILSYGSEEVAMKVINARGATEVYQWLNTIQNLAPLVQNNQTAKALFPKRTSSYAKEMQNTFCFAISKNGDEYQWFGLRYNPYEVKSIDVALAPSTLTDIKTWLNSYDYNARLDVEKRFNFIEKEAQRIQDEKKKQEEYLKSIKEKRNQVLRDNQLVERLRQTAFLCNDEPEKFSGQNWYH